MHFSSPVVSLQSEPHLLSWLECTVTAGVVQLARTLVRLLLHKVSSSKTCSSLKLFCMDFTFAALAPELQSKSDEEI